MVFALPKHVRKNDNQNMTVLLSVCPRAYPEMLDKSHLKKDKNPTFFFNLMSANNMAWISTLNILRRIIYRNNGLVCIHFMTVVTIFQYFFSESLKAHTLQPFHLSH